jgi:hypothetical protein
MERAMKTSAKKKKRRSGKSTQDIIGIRAFTKYGLSTIRGDLIYYLISPANLAVLSSENIEIKVRHLLMVLEGVPDIEFICMDSCECFDENKRYVLSRLEEEENPAVRDVLEKDIENLDSIQIEMSNDRQFLLTKRLKSDKDEQAFTEMNRTLKIITEQGFEVRRLEKQDVKRMLAIYFGASMNGELMGDHDGEQFLAGRKMGEKKLTEEEKEIFAAKDFFDMILPSTLKFFSDSYICGDKYASVWAIREYPPSTDEQAIFARLADHEGVTLHIYNRPVDAIEQRKIIQNATRKNRLMTGGTDVQDAVTAENNLQDVADLITTMRRDKEPLIHTAAYIELRASEPGKLKELQSEILMELTRSKVSVDHLTLRQQEGLLSALPVGANRFGAQFERVLPASSVANLYPFNYSGKTDPAGFLLGRDKFGTNILVDFDRRADDKTNANVLILGNSGQGKSYLMKLILTNIRESGKTIIALDAEAEYEELTSAMGGCYIDFMSGRYTINPLEPKAWADSELALDVDQGSPEAFRKVTRLSQHISYLKDFFRSYKDFSDALIDTIEIMVSKLYCEFGITDMTDHSRLAPTDYPVMRDLYDLIEREFAAYGNYEKRLYTEDMLQEILLGLHSMCVGAESKYFNGHTNIVDDKWLCFGVKGLLDTNKRLKDTMLFNLLSYMSNELLAKGNAVASIDELYLFLTNLTAIEYIRNAAKRVRKKDSAIILASQNVDDFLLEGIREYTKPLFAIPTHQCLFNAGQVEPRAYTETLQLEQAEFDLIKYPERGTCLYRCGNERYLLKVIAPEYKAAMFGSSGGR